MSLWRKRNVKHNEQKHDNLSNPLDRLHEENVRLGLYEDAYDLSIKSDDLSIKSNQAIAKAEKQEPVAWQWLTTAHFRKKLPKDAEKGAWNPLYTTPQQRTWVGLTDEVIIELAKKYCSGYEFENGDVYDCYKFSKEELIAFAQLIAEKGYV